MLACTPRLPHSSHSFQQRPWTVLSPVPPPRRPATGVACALFPAHSLLRRARARKALACRQRGRHLRAAPLRRIFTRERANERSRAEAVQQLLFPRRNIANVSALFTCKCHTIEYFGFNHSYFWLGICKDDLSASCLVILSHPHAATSEQEFTDLD